MTRVLRGVAVAVLAVLAFCVAVACGIVAEHPGADAGDAGKRDGGVRCEPPMLDCDGTCTSLERDPGNCGACGAPCPDHGPCADGACSTTGCPGGESQCGGLCVDTRTNPFNCGACGKSCGDQEICVGGTCACPSGFSICDEVCINTRESMSSCGECGHQCATDERCTNGACTPVCPPGALNCSGVCYDPESPSSCGACTVLCKVAESCVGGTCVCTQDAFHAVCDGVCVDLRADGPNCGGCGKACPAATQCSDGKCEPCKGGLFFCPSLYGDLLATCRAQAATAADSGANAGSADLGCQCNHCLQELVDCAHDPQCVAAWQCAATKQCDMPCWGTMGVCALSAGSVGTCWKFCPPGAGTTQTMTRAEALLRCTQQNGCGTRP